MSPTRVTALAVLLGSLLLALDTLGQQQRTPYPPRPETNAAKPVMEKVAKARAEVSKAQTAANQVAGKVRGEFEAGAEWQAASAAQKQAQADADAARKRVLESVHDSPAYKQAQVAKKSADAELAQLKTDNVSTQDLTAGATKAMNAGSVLSKMDADGLAGDAKFVEAKKKLLEANAKLATLGKQADELVKADTNWQAARKDVEAAEAAKAQVDKELAAAQAQDAQTLAQWRQQCAQIDQQNRDRAAQEAQQRRQQNQNNNNMRR
jgi:hypothetical protein